MEGKKERFKFLKNISERFKSLDGKQKRLLIIIASIIVALVIISIITSIIFAGIVGNAGKVVGNLNNKGFVVTKGNKVYLSNTGINDGQEGKSGLFEINKDNKVKLIEESEWIRSINYYKGYVYFLSMNIIDDSTGNYERQIIKMKPNGEKKTVLVDDIETDSIGNDSLNVSDGWVYYLNSDKKLEKIKTNKSKRQQISDEQIEQFQICGKYIYYTTVDDEFGRMKKDGSNREKIENGIGKFQVVGNDVYYISAANNHLIKLDLAQKEGKKETEVVSKAISTFNIYEKTIYYAVHEIGASENEQEEAIYRINTNGKKNQKIVDLSSNNNVSICIAGKWIYYTDKVEDSPYYHAIYKIKTNGEDKQKVELNVK